MSKKTHHLLTASIFLLTLIGSGFWFMMPPIEAKAEKVEKKEDVLPDTSKSVVIYLHTMTLELREGKAVLLTLPLLSQGKPGSYYETIGGVYENDYKTPLHFSSIGHVYMPHSVHLFGNYFIHGVPYYPNGDKVSSAYSGGCIRLSDENAKTVYDFIEKGTPIIVTRDTSLSFEGTELASTTLTSIEMTNLMVAAISLEVLTQDNQITSIDGRSITTRKSILPLLIKDGDSSVAQLYANSLGEQTFVALMNQKAEALGLTNTHFDDVVSPVPTTYEDYVRFMTYISTYKSYLRNIPVSK